MNKILAAAGGDKELKAYRNAVIVHDYTVEFSQLYVDRFSRTQDQMVQAARSGKQNIVEGNMAAATSGKTELRLTNVARASLEELLEDYKDHLRQHGLTLWPAQSPKALTIRSLAHTSYLSYSSYKSYLHSPEPAANAAICLIHQTNYLIDRLLKTLEKRFLAEGGFTERLYKSRKGARGY